MLDPSCSNAFPLALKARIRDLSEAIANEVCTHETSSEELTNEFAILLVKARKLRGAQVVRLKT